MFGIERRSKLLALLNDNKSILVQEAAAAFGVTEETIRRDLKELEAQGLLKRTHGGAIPADDSKSEFPLKIREGINISAKDAIGREASKLVSDGDTIMLDASTSSLFLARHLKDKKSLTVITNAERIILELSECSDMTLISTGGILRHKSLSYVGRAAEKALANYTAEKFFFSCKGFSPNRGLMDSNEQEAEIKRIMLQRSEKAVFLCDHTKFGHVGFETVLRLDDLDTIITDSSFPSEWIPEMQRKATTIIYANL